MYRQAPSFAYHDLGIVEDGDTASQAIEKDKFVIWKGASYFASTDIMQGATLEEDVNLTAIPDGVINGVVEAVNSKIKLFPDPTRILENHKSSGVAVNYTATEDCYFIGWVIASDANTTLKLNNVEIMITAYSSPSGQSWTLYSGSASMFLKQGDFLKSTGVMRYIIMGLR